MNERWLDHVGDTPFCSGVSYSILIRDPIKRALSSLNWAHYSGFDQNRINILSHNCNSHAFNVFLINSDW